MRTRKPKATGFANYAVIPGWGYLVEVFSFEQWHKTGQPVERHTAGNSVRDSQSYGARGANALSTKTLTGYAKATAKDLLKEHGIVCSAAGINHDQDLADSYDRTPA